MTSEGTGGAKAGALPEREAVAWFTRMSGRPTRTERRDFDAWRTASPEHERAYAEVSALWADLGADLGAVLPEDDDLREPLERIAAFRRRKRKAAARALAAGALALLVAGLWLWVDDPDFARNIGADHATATAERRTVTLPDGSTVLMDADTALAAAVSPAERRVRLLRGSAFFAVRPGEVPFVVEAGNGAARVLGTTFDVALDADGDVTVTLSSGSLAVSGEDGQVTLAPGESVAYGPDGLGPARRVNVAQSMAWHEGRLVFDNARLADVLARIGRYRDGRIVLIGSAVGERRVTGNIALDRAEAALEAMQSSVGFRMMRLGKLTLIGP